MIDEPRLLSLAREMIRTNSESPPGREIDVANVLHEHMDAYGFFSKRIGPAERPNLLFSTHDTFSSPLVLHGHMDTVPIGPLDLWEHDPFSADIIKNKLYGRGACDMKGPLASIAETMILYKEAKNSTPLVMLATSDEESGCSGAENVAASGLLHDVKYGICGEPTSLEVLVGEKGMLWTKILAEGRSAHGSRPEGGLNAINLCIDAIRAITSQPFFYEDSELMGKPTISIGIIKGGIKINVVPDSCEAHVDMRLVKGQELDLVVNEMRNRVKSAGLDENVQIEYIHGKPAVVTPVSAEIVSCTVEAVQEITGQVSELRAATYGTDCSVLQPKIGIINVICGPGSIEKAHQPNEFVSIKELYDAVKIYLKVARKLGGS